MTPVELLQQKFQATKYGNVTDWIRGEGVELSLQTCTRILLRGDDMGIVAMLSIAACLGCTPEELRWIAKEKGDKILHKFISSNAVAHDETELLEAYSSLSSHQKAAVLTMVRGMK